MSRTYTRSQQTSNILFGVERTVQIDCLKGDVATGGGFRARGDIRVTQSRGATDNTIGGSITRWIAGAEGTGIFGGNVLDVFVICVSRG